ncbi:hypothetical protein IMSHALPRED_002712 [Imshaugia aleurites]|uniref:DNA2/NAM7 helicase helicase domain-containing protein n=1 Tax=Imshaugia aleurites TaxID=172621 RepID=A0A8H3ICM5_9LECA|nr:hypothetical protein IMSHALPRED_002712 [Imshaugia aleurites]
MTILTLCTKNTHKGPNKAVDKKRAKETPGNRKAQIERDIICGRDGTIHSMVDLLEGLDTATLESFGWNLTASQRHFIYKYCRRIFNSIGILQGPPGSGKTTIIKALVQIAKARGHKVAIVTEANSAADNVIKMIADDTKYIAVRLHGPGLERRELIRNSRKGMEGRLEPADSEPLSEAGSDDDEDFQVTKKLESFKTANAFKDMGAEEIIVGESGSDNGEDDSFGDTDKPEVPDQKTVDTADETDAPGTTVVDASHQIDNPGLAWKDDTISIMYTDLVMKAAQAKFEAVSSILAPDDPRMKVIASAVWTWVLRVLDLILKNPNAIEINSILEEVSLTVIWKSLGMLISKSKKQDLNRAEWTKYSKLMEDATAMFLKRAVHATVCTIPQLTNDWAKGVEYNIILIDEATKMTEATIFNYVPPRLRQAAIDYLRIDHLRRLRSCT